MLVNFDVSGQQGMEFLEEALLWILDSYISQKWRFKVKMP